MSTLRELLEAKQRRRVVVPIQVSDPSADHETWMGITVALETARARDDTEAVAKLEAHRAEVGEQLQAHWVNIELQALPSQEWEHASQVWRAEVDGADAEDGIDWPNALAPLLAESCVAEDLRDADWWREQLGQPGWSEGDRNALKLALLRLNVSAVEPHIPKD